MVYSVHSTYALGALQSLMNTKYRITRWSYGDDNLFLAPSSWPLRNIQDEQASGPCVLYCSRWFKEYKKKKRIQNEKNFGPFLQEHIPWLADGPIVMISPDSFVYKFSCILKFNNGILLYTRHYAAYSPHLQMPDLVTTLRGRQYYPNFSD